MKKTNRLFLWAILFMAVMLQANAQNAGKTNLIPNGGFEEWKNKEPAGWNLASSFVAEKVEDVRPGTSGKYALKIWTNGENIFMLRSIPVSERKKYTFSLWHKSSMANHDIRLYLIKYDGDNPIGRIDMPKAKAGTAWEMSEMTVDIPEGTNNIRFTIAPKFSNKAHLLLDDISLVPGGEGSTPLPGLKAPENLKVKPYQGEMEISWDKAADSGIRWEITFDGKVEAAVSGNSYMKTKLKPGSEHQVKVRALKGKEASAYAETRGRTEKMRGTEGSEERIPYLRTLSESGSNKGRFLKLYYNELANPDAKISYYLDGMPVEPKNDALEFPDFGGTGKEFELKICIDEGNGREWEILYPKLRVEKNNTN